MRRFLFIISVITLSTSAIQADSWRDKMPFLIYSPRYFGPNAFPVPELRSARVGKQLEVEMRGTYHYYSGDKTKDIYGRILIPFVKERVAIEVSMVFKEKYLMTPETRDERYAVETESPIGCHGDVIVSTILQVLKSEKWADVMCSINLKTASGNRLCDARYTDATAYWFDATVGRNLFQSKNNHFSLRAQAMVGFYCWSTNSLVHRQNDAISYGGGLTGTYRNFSLSTDLSGFHGYKDNGDWPLILRNNLRYEIKKNILSLRYNHGMKDNLYETYSLAYIRCF